MIDSICATLLENLILLHAKKNADQPAHPQSQISTFFNIWKIE